MEIYGVLEKILLGEESATGPVSLFVYVLAL